MTSRMDYMVSAEAWDDRGMTCFRSTGKRAARVQVTLRCKIQEAAAS